MKYAVDLGNSLTKIGIFVEDRLVEVKEFSELSRAIDYLNALRNAEIIIGSVTVDAREVAANIDASNRVLILNNKTPVPVSIHYKTPETLGVDRIAAVVGAVFISPGKNNLVVDMGTSITYEIVDAERNYYGGLITPGINMKFQALHQLTSRLPLIEMEKLQVELTGQSTKEAIESGVINGTVAEVEGLIGQYRSRFPDLQVILTGGIAPDFESMLKAPIFASPNLVLIGLNQILTYNE